jgi:hypothetical protein
MIKWIKMSIKNRKQAGGWEKNGYGRFLENSYFNSRFLQRAGRKELKTYSVSKFSNLEYLKWLGQKNFFEACYIKLVFSLQPLHWWFSKSADALLFKIQNSELSILIHKRILSVTLLTLKKHTESRLKSWKIIAACDKYILEHFHLIQ